MTNIPVVPRAVRLGLSALLLSLAEAPALRAQAGAAKFIDSARVEIDRAVLANDAPRLGGAVLLLDRALVAFPNDPMLLHYRGYAAYRQAIARFVAGDMPSAAPFIERGLADLETSGDKLAWPETFEIQSALTAFQIALDPSRGAELGAIVGGLSAQASRLGPANPRVLLIQAEGALKTPPEYGGGVEQARALADRAIKAFENDHPAPLAPAWGREEAAAFRQQFNRGGAPRR